LGGIAVSKDFTPHQQKIIRRYYSNQDTIQRQKLAELVTDLYLADGAKRAAIWKRAEAAMQKLSVPTKRIEHVVKSGDPAILAQVVKELEGK
jgi:hypothetical protein